jgi:dipeptidyl aminopeptidase/acylaminoacyl peptidase
MKSTIQSLLLGALIATAVLASDGPKRAFEIADYYRTAFVGVPVLSPDGTTVAFDIRRFDLEKGKTWFEIWVMEPDGSRQRRMTAGDHDDSDPIFTADGKTLLFTSDRSDSGQIWSLPLDGGEAKQLTDFGPGVSAPVLSPDGKYIAVTSNIYPECGIDATCNENLKKDKTEGDLRVRVADSLLHRHWNFWREGSYKHILLLDASTGAVVRDLTPGPWDSPNFDLGGRRAYDFSPDSKHLVYTSNRDLDAAESTNSDLWLIPVGADLDENSARNLTADNRGWDGAPLFSPDGNTIAYLSQKTPSYESDLYRLSLVDVESGEISYVTDRGSFDNWIDEIAWTSDGKQILFQAEVEGTTPLYRIDLASRRIDPILTHAYISGWTLTPDEQSILYARRSVGSPSEIFSVDIGGAEPDRLTTFNLSLEEEVDIRPAEVMWFDGDGDYKVHTFIVKPHDFDPHKKYPLILNVHGGPQSQWADTYRGDWQVYPGKGYIVAFANPTGSSGFGQDFVDGIACDWGGRVYRDLMKVADGLEQLPYVDADRMGAMGWSYGGYMMMWFQGHTDRFKATVAMMGLYDLRSFHGATEELWFPEKDLCGTPWTSEHYETWSPSNFVENFKTPALVITGENDFRVPYTQSLMYFTALQKQGVPSRLVVFPKAGHWPGWQEMAFYYNAHLDWFHQWLGGEPGPWDLNEHARNRAFGQDEEDESE